MKEWMNQPEKSREDRIIEAAFDRVLLTLCLAVVAMLAWTLIAFAFGYWMGG